MSNLTARGVFYTYQTKKRIVKALNGLSYEFVSGKLYAILGKSGSGKTTLLSLLAGLDLPKEGEVLLDGVSTSVCNRDDLRRDRIAVIYQDYNLFPLLTVLENVLYPLKLKKIPTEEARKIAKEKLQAVDLSEDCHKRFPHMLSGGEQQRVAIARALAGSGDIILADEPTGNLDTENGKNIICILKNLAHAENYCIIIVTHDIGITEEADILLRMQDGVLVNCVPGICGSRLL